MVSSLNKNMKRINERASEMIIGKSTSHSVLKEDERSLRKKARVIILIPKEGTDHSSWMTLP